MVDICNINLLSRNLSISSLVIPGVSVVALIILITLQCSVIPTEKTFLYLNGKVIEESKKGRWNTCMHTFIPGMLLSFSSESDLSHTSILYHLHHNTISNI